MASLNWIIVLQQAWTLVLILLSVVPALAAGSCSRDVSTLAHSCFTAYSTHFQNMRVSPQKLCCGVDVETLRAFCHSYMSAVACVEQLKKPCPSDVRKDIDKALTNLDGARAGLHELCSDDSIIENYAMYQSCFTLAGPGSQMCFDTYINNSSHTNIKFLSRISTDRMDTFCNDMRNTVACVQKNVGQLCGQSAADLAAILVKPMVRQSTDCDYSVISAQHKTTRGPQHGHHAYISDEHSERGAQDESTHNSASDVTGSSYVTATMTSLLAVLVFTAGRGALVWAS